jgi:hypothetical protein
MGNQNVRAPVDLIRLTSPVVSFNTVPLNETKYCTNGMKNILNYQEPVWNQKHLSKKIPQCPK